jgi:hypothetical protein
MCVQIAGFASHLGQPNTFDFAFEFMAPRWPPLWLAPPGWIPHGPLPSFPPPKPPPLEGAAANDAEAATAAPPPAGPPGRPSPPPQPIGGARDEHGCLVAAGYAWCAALEQCARPWEGVCPGKAKSTEAAACTGGVGVAGGRAHSARTIRA